MLHALLSDPVRFIKSNQKQGQDYTTLGLTPVNDPNLPLLRHASRSRSSILCCCIRTLRNSMASAMAMSKSRHHPQRTASQVPRFVPVQDLAPVPGQGAQRRNRPCQLRQHVLHEQCHAISHPHATARIRPSHPGPGFASWRMGRQTQRAFDAVSAMQSFTKASLLGSKNPPTPLATSTVTSNPSQTPPPRSSRRRSRIPPFPPRSASAVVPLACTQGVETRRPGTTHNVHPKNVRRQAAQSRHLPRLRSQLGHL